VLARQIVYNLSHYTNPPSFLLCLSSYFFSFFSCLSSYSLIFSYFGSSPISLAITEDCLWAGANWLLGGYKLKGGQCFWSGGRLSNLKYLIFKIMVIPSTFQIVRAKSSLLGPSNCQAYICDKGSWRRKENLWSYWIRRKTIF
jgi:hypothetical protein